MHLQVFLFDFHVAEHESLFFSPNICLPSSTGASCHNVCRWVFLFEQVQHNALCIVLLYLFILIHPLIINTFIHH